MITLSKLARLANVSVSTASKAFSGSGEVSRETKEMIYAVAKEHGCFKKFYNVKYPKLVVAVVAPEFDSAFYTRYLSSIQKYLGRENCELCVSTTDFSMEREATLLEYYDKHSGADGVIIIGSRSGIAESCDVPVVLINPGASSGRGALVLSDIRPAFSESIDYLLSKNVSSVGFIGEKLTDVKLSLFKQILEEKNIPCDGRYISVSDGRFEEGGYSAMEGLISNGQIPRAVICAYDYMAIGAIRCIHDHGLSVPEDVAVLGFDDIPQAKFLNPPLASISTPTDELCRAAAEALLKQIGGEAAEPQEIAVSRFHLRRSFEIV